MNRTSKYYYDENEKLTRLETYETYEGEDLCDECEDGVLLEDSIELPGEEISPLGMATVILSSIGLGISIARLLKDK